MTISHPPKGPSRNGALLKLTLCRSSSQLSHFDVDSFLSSITKILFFTNTTIYNNKLYYSLPKKNQSFLLSTLKICSNMELSQALPYRIFFRE